MRYGFGKYPIADAQGDLRVLHFADYLSGILLLILHIGSPQAGQIIGGIGYFISLAHPPEKRRIAELPLGVGGPGGIKQYVLPTYKQQLQRGIRFSLSIPLNSGLFLRKSILSTI